MNAESVGERQIDHHITFMWSVRRAKEEAFPRDIHYADIRWASRSSSEKTII